MGAPKLKDSIFIWVPKTAGTSMFHALGCDQVLKLEKESNVVWRGSEEDRIKFGFSQFNSTHHGDLVPKGCVTWGHTHPVVIRDHIVDPVAWDRAFKFSFVRNPFCRMVSLYSFVTRKLALRYIAEYPPDHVLARMFSALQRTTFAQFCAAIEDGVIVLKGVEIPVRIEPVAVWKVGLSQLGVQVNWIVDKGKTIPDFVGRFENLDKDWPKVLEVLGADQSISLKQLNSTGLKGYVGYYGGREKKFVSKFYEEDLDTFKYVF